MIWWLIKYTILRKAFILKHFCICWVILWSWKINENDLMHYVASQGLCFSLCDLTLFCKGKCVYSLYVDQDMWLCLSYDWFQMITYQTYGCNNLPYLTGDKPGNTCKHMPSDKAQAPAPSYILWPGSYQTFVLWLGLYPEISPHPLLGLISLSKLPGLIAGQRRH